MELRETMADQWSPSHYAAERVWCIWWTASSIILVHTHTHTQAQKTPSPPSKLTHRFTLVGSTNTPWFGRHLKYLTPDFDPSFLPPAWSNSTPNQNLENNVIIESINLWSVNQIWQFWVEIKHHSVAFFNRVTTFEAL